MQGTRLGTTGSMMNKMGHCLSCCKRQEVNSLKQDKNIDDKRMFKLGIDVLNRDFCVQIGYNRKAVKTYGKGVETQLPSEEGPQNGDPENTVS